MHEIVPTSVDALQSCREDIRTRPRLSIIVRDLEDDPLASSLQVRLSKALWNVLLQKEHTESIYSMRHNIQYI